MRDLFFLTCGQMRAPGAAISPISLRSALTLGTMSMTVAVIVRQNGDLVLVDAGFSETTCRNASTALGKIRALSLGVDLCARDGIATQLRVLGFDTSRVTTIIATHFHLDHIDGARDFPNAEVIVSQRELTGLFRFPPDPGYRVDDLAREGRLRVVAVEGEPMLGFPKSRDLFGDGRVILLDARGHTTGNTAVALMGGERPYVHIGDAVYSSWEYGTETPGPSALARLTAHDRVALLETYGCIRACAADPSRPIIVPSHDVEVFRTLPRRPQVDHERANAPA